MNNNDRTESCLHHLFELQAQQSPDAVAVTFEQIHLTYKELNCRANQLANYLRRLNIGPEVVVGLYMERSLEVIIAIIGILKAGGAVMVLDPAYPHNRLVFMMNNSRVSVLLTSQRLVPKLPAPSAQIVCLDRDWANITQESSEAPYVAV